MNPDTYWKEKGKAYYKNFDFNDKLVKYQESEVMGYLRTNASIEEVKTILEVGCGFGRYTKLLLGCFPRTTRYCAIDISRDQLEKARDYVNDTRVIYIETSVKDFSSTDKYDLVFAGEILFQILPEDIENIVHKLLFLTNKHFIHIDPEIQYYRTELYLYGDEQQVVDYAFFHDYESINKRISPLVKQRYTPIRRVHQAIYHIVV
jgi:SAM-dependent methyltransferase